ncbi:hypothetical protein Pmani_003873 [Petrolisthes manimaculis]|uniref:HAT C-terminal dimerisation domain-containing protein n=1 Tax=Petrolisthes manimaculis TaxID=1843537 RepID=A0AAE1QFW7_9EUCA|nr:hypothetical protein Pmani_003873 [Petrolisthes manimaculis]
MVGRYRGFASLLKEKVPDVRTVHCVLNRQHLVAKKLSGELHDALKVCIRAVNKIKGHPLNSRLFALLCDENDDMFNQLLLHTEVRWLSRGHSLQRLVDLYDSTVQFLADVDSSLCEELKKCKNALLYLADLYYKFNEIQKRLQGKNVTIIQARTVLLGFQGKLSLFRASLARRDFHYFSNLQQIQSESISDGDLEIYMTHLDNLIEDFKVRFEDLAKMKVPEWILTPIEVEIGNSDIALHLEEEFTDMTVDLEASSLFRRKGLQFEEEEGKLVRNPFSGTLDITTIPSDVQDEFLDLKHDSAAKDLYEEKSLNVFWCSMHQSYPKVSEIALRLLLPFSTTYLCESGFSTLLQIKNKSRNRLDVDPDMRCALSVTQPRIRQLTEKKQYQPSH